jgi:hypothetical protein
MFFKGTHPEKLVNVPLSVYQNSLLPINIGQFKNVLSTERYFMVELVSKDKNEAMV